MNMTRHRAGAGQVRRLGIAGLAASLSIVGLSACDTLLEANAPSRILESTLLQPSNATVLVAGVLDSLVA